MIKPNLLLFQWNRWLLFVLAATFGWRNTHLNYLTYTLSWVWLDNFTFSLDNLGRWFFWHSDHRRFLVLWWIHDLASFLQGHHFIWNQVVRNSICGKGPSYVWVFWRLLYDCWLFVLNVSTVKDILLLLSLSHVGFSHVLNVLFVSRPRFNLRCRWSNGVQFPLLQALVVLPIRVIVDHSLIFSWDIANTASYKRLSGWAWHWRFC